MAIITIPKKVTKGEELIIIPKREYERFLRTQERKKDITDEDVLQWSQEAKKLKKEGRLPTLHSLADFR